MTCGWCGGSIASANKPHMKGQCEMGNWEAEKCEYPECNRKKWTGMYCSEHYKERWPRTYAQLIKERDNQGQSLQAKYDALEQAARDAVENAVFYDPECDDCMGVADGENHSHECLVIKLSNLLEGE